MELNVEQIRIGQLVKYKTGQIAKIKSIILLSGSYFIETEGVNDAYLDGCFAIEDFTTNE